MKNKHIISNHESFPTPRSQPSPINLSKESMEKESLSEKENSLPNIGDTSSTSLSVNNKQYNIIDEDNDSFDIDQRKNLQGKKQAIKVRHP